MDLLDVICAPASRHRLGKKHIIDIQRVIVHFYVDNWLVSFKSENGALSHAHLVTSAL